jgi:Na+/H+-dicarboxylate symporter
MSIPLIFLLGYGIPGIPGELIIFAGPIAIILGLPQDVVPVFLALYVGFQIGLPDSFRTGANSTDNCVSGLILQDLYERQYQIQPGLEPEAVKI